MQDRWGRQGAAVRASVKAASAGLGLVALCLLAGCGGGEHPWTDASQRLEVSCWSYWQGGMDFRADRSELTGQQLALASDLETTDGDNGCWEDTLGCTVRITDTAGAVATYYAEEHNGVCNSDATYIDYATLKPLLDTIPCSYGQRDGGAVPDARCINGVFSPNSGTTTRRDLALPSADRTYHVDLVDCAQPTRADNVTMSVFGADPNTPIAVGTRVATPGPDGACWSLEIASPTVSTATLVVTTTPDFMPAGDFGFVFR